MRLLPLLCSLWITLSSVASDGKGQYVNNQAQQTANIDRMNTISLVSNQGVSINSYSLSYNPATVNTTSSLSYDQVNIDARATKSGGNKFEIKIVSTNYTKTGSGRLASVDANEFKFAWRPFSIVQYVETSVDDSNAVLQNGFDANDTLCHNYRLRPRADDFTFRWTGSSALENGTLILHQYEGVSGDGVFKIVLKATGESEDSTTMKGKSTKAKSVWIDQRFVSPTSVKFDVILNVTRPNFQLNTSDACTNYQIAIVSWARSKQEVYARRTDKTVINGTVTNTTKQVTRLDRIQSGGAASPFGFFTWADTATVNTSTVTDGKTNVIATSFQKVKNTEDSDDLSVTKEAVHSFDAIRPTTIVWDPEFGTDSADPDSTTTTVTAEPTTTAPTTTTGPTTTGPTTTTSTSNTASIMTSSTLALVLSFIVALFAQ